MRVGLPRALAPRDSVDLDIAWAFQVPPDGAPREGTTGDVFMIAYWYPRLAVYDDVTGWQIDPYLGTAEFYMGYADYDVNLNVPQGWLVGGDGRADESERGVVEADARPPRRGAASDERRARRARAGSRRRRDEGDDDGFRRRAHVEVPRAQRSRLRLGRVVEVRVGRDDRGRRRSRRRRTCPTRRRINTFYRPDARAWSWDKSARVRDEAPSSSCPATCGRIRGRR